MRISFIVYLLRFIAKMGDASPTKAKKAKASKPAEHPKYLEMIVKAIETLKDRRGSSRQAIVKYVKHNFKVGDNSDSHVKAALRKAVSNGLINQVKGTGASGSFKLISKKVTKNKTEPTAKKVPAKKSTTPKKAAAVVKKSSAKKVKKVVPAVKKKTAAAKSKTTTPNKKAVKKPVAAKKPASKKATKPKPKKKTGKGKGKGK